MDDPQQVHWAVYVFGIIAGAIFYTRFYVQWAYSEYKGRSLVPPAFWYQSAIGSILLLIYAAITQSPLGALSQSINVFPYSRNLVYIWKEKGEPSRRLLMFMNAIVVFCVAFGLGVVAWTWFREFEMSRAVSADTARQNWFWLAIGVTGQGLFGTRFLIQWIATERKKKSVVPTAFWYISVIASILMCASFFQRGDQEWVYAIGTITNMLIYARNIWLIHTRGPEEVAEKAPTS